MALLPMGPPSEGTEMQESMFDEQTNFPATYFDEGVEAPEEVIEAAEEELIDEEIGEEISGPVAKVEERVVEPVTAAVEEVAAKPDSVEEPVVEAADTALPLTVDDFAALEERVVRAVSLVRRERQARTEAEIRVKELEAQVLEQLPLVEQLQSEVDSLRKEREQVRQRVERLLNQLDALEL